MKKGGSLNFILIFFIFLTLFACNEQTKQRRKKKKEKRKVVQPLSEKEVKRKSEKLEEYFTKLQKERAFNGVVLAARGNQVVFKKAFGFRDFKTKDSLSTESIFQLASVSKQFTAAAIMLLKQKGLLNYEDSIQKFFPSFPYTGITVRHLLTHKSGLSNYTYFCDKVWDRKKAISNQNVIDLMAQHKPKEYYAPGVKFDYSNTGYMLLAAIVEKVSKVKFEEFMLRYIFKPAGMKNSFVYNHCSPVVVIDAVEGYNGGRRKVGKTYLDGVFGDKGVYSTASDLYYWDRALHEGTILKHSTLEEAFKPAHTFKTARDNYGFGWRIKDYSGDKVVWHGGWWEGYKTMFIRNLKDETVIIVLSNSLRGHFRANELLDLYYDKPFTSPEL